LLELVPNLYVEKVLHGAPVVTDAVNLVLLKTVASLSH